MPGYRRLRACLCRSGRSSSWAANSELASVADRRCARCPGSDLFRYRVSGFRYWPNERLTRPAWWSPAVPGWSVGPSSRFDPQHLDTALHHYSESIRYATAAGNTYGAGQTRCNATIDLASNTRASEALAWAIAALRDYQAVGPGAQTDADRTRALIAELQP